jgi:DNA-3-methyladenine glycosylase
VTRERLQREHFNRPTLHVARGLIGTYIVRNLGGRRMSAMIAETEAYKGPRDAASHAYGGRRTARVEPLYRDGGTAYVYLVYGMHWLLNFSTAGAGNPEGVLIRAIMVEENGSPRFIVGPGLLTRYLHIDKRQDGIDATTSKELWLENRDEHVRGIKQGPRIGVDYSGAYWAARPWRFWIEAR